MEENFTQINSPAQNANPAQNTKPAKKQWQKPDFYLLDRNEEVKGGPVFTGIEGAPTIPNASKSYHS